MFYDENIDGSYYQLIDSNYEGKNNKPSRIEFEFSYPTGAEITSDTQLSEKSMSILGVITNI